jgi:cytosine/adenosine deaminase-related metal-dependent hydrolase
LSPDQRSTTLFKNTHLINHDAVLKGVNVAVQGDMIAEVGESVCPRAPELTLDLSGKYTFPGIINSHDHLVGEWTPRIGRNRPYRNAEEWQVDFLDQDNPCQDYVEKRKVMDKNLDAIIWLGIYKNLFSGTTLVSDHFHYSDGFPISAPPIRVVDKFTQCHSIYWGNFWGGDECTEEFKKAGGEMPFIIHIGEGLDENTRQELTKLHRMGCLESNTLLIHGICFDERDADLLSAKNASLVWCPDSNRYLIGQTADIPLLMGKGINIALGTDSSMSGSQSMFEELRAAKQAYRQMAGAPLDDRILFGMISEKASSSLMVREAGYIKPGAWADILVMDPVAEDPYQSLVNSNPENIHLLFCRGRPVLMDAGIADQIKSQDMTYTPVNVNGKEMLVAGDPFKPVQDVSEILGYSKKFDFLPFDH